MYLSEGCSWSAVWDELRSFVVRHFASPNPWSICHWGGILDSLNQTFCNHTCKPPRLVGIPMVPPDSVVRFAIDIVGALLMVYAMAS